MPATELKPVADTGSFAYAHGYEQGLLGKTFRNPCSGNPIGTNDHYFGWLNGDAARQRGSEIDALKPVEAA